MLVSAGLAAFCMTFCCFGFVSADLGSSRCFLRDLGLNILIDFSASDWLTGNKIPISLF